MIALVKMKGQFVIRKETQEFEDTYNKVHMDVDFFKSLQIDSSVIPKSHWLYPELSHYMDLVNIFTEKVDVPNKRVETNKLGTSKLVRHPNSGNIEIAYRAKKKDGTQEKFATSPNTCYITNEDRERFFADVKSGGRILAGEHGSRYMLCEGDVAYTFWSEFMDREYISLSGIDFKKKRHQTKIVPESKREETYIEDYRSLICHLFGELTIQFEIKVFSEMAEQGLCKLSREKEALYDKDGFFLQLTKYPTRTDSFDKILSKLTVDELRKVKTILNQYLL